MRVTTKIRLHREWLILVAILVVGATLRLLYLREISTRPDFTHPGIDAAYHIYWARGLATGRWEGPPGRDDPQVYRYPYYRPPGYAFFLALVYRVFGLGPWAPRLFQGLIGLGSAALAFFLGRKWMGSAAGLIFAFLVAFYWIFILYEGELLDPAPSVFLSLAVVGLVAGVVDGFKAWRGPAAGVVLGALAIFRPNALVLLPLLGAWMVWAGDRRGQRRRAWWGALGLALGTAAAIFPVTLRNYLVGGEWVMISTNQGISLLVANNPASDGTTHTIPELGDIGTPFDYPRIVRQLGERMGRPLTPVQVSDYLSWEAVSFARENPGRFLGLLGRKALLFWGPGEVRNVKEVHYARLNSRVLRAIPLNFSLALTLGLMGLGWWWWDRKRAEVIPGWAEVGWLPALAAVGYFVSMLPFAVAARYRVPAIPFLLWLGAWGIRRWAELARAGKWKPAGVALVVGGVVCLLVSRNWVGYRPSPEKWHYDLGLAYFEKGEIKAAREAFHEAVRLRPDFYRARHNLANVLVLEEDHISALANFQEVLRHSPDQAEVHNSLGNLLYNMGKPEEAMKHFQRALSLDPELAEAWNNLGSALAVQEKYRQAVESYRRALELRPGNISFQLNQASALVYYGEVEEAGTIFKMILEADPGNQAARDGLESLEKPWPGDRGVGENTGY